MSLRAALIALLDAATRPVLVPAYLLAARWSVGYVRRLRSRAEATAAAECEPPPSWLLDCPAPAEPPEWPTVAVVVPVLNGEAVLGRCLESLRALDYPRNRMEIIVADNGSTDRSAEIAQKLGARVVKQPKRGAAAARNSAVAAARTEWIAMTDADCAVHPLWLKHLTAAALREKCAAVGGRILSICRDPVVGEFCAREAVLDQSAAVAGRLLPFPFIITANALFRREALEAVGGFDEDFADAAAEDVDLGWRLSDIGVAMTFAPHALIAHRQRERAGDIHAQFYRYGLSEVRLYLKHALRFSRRDLSKHLWIRPVLYRHFWKALLNWAAARDAATKRLWRLILFKELGHMAGKMEGARRWKTWRYFRLWTWE
ncbi:MAG: glycosyltransferase [Candidatus Sumerlaeia bacterium]|nr:glycosyltransferase [Candidatus Sumerlaeia bacterium]